MTLNLFAQRPALERSPVVGWAMVMFFVCFVTAIFAKLPILVVPALVAFAVSWIVSKRDKKRHESMLLKFRNDNAQRFQNIFDSPPPSNLDAIDEEYLDLYDTETCLYIGRVPKHDIQTIFDFYDNEPLVFENGPNDIPFTQDFIQSIEESKTHNLSAEFLDSMKNAMDDKYLTLVTIRWTPASENAG